MSLAEARYELKGTGADVKSFIFTLFLGIFKSDSLLIGVKNEATIGASLVMVSNDEGI